MKILFVVAALCLISIASGLAPLINMESTSIVPDQYMVVLHTDIDADTRDKHVEELTLRLTGKEKVFNKFHIGRLIGYSAVLSKDTMAGLLEHPHVRYIEADQIATAVDSTVVQQGSTWGISRVGKRDLPIATSYPYFASAGSGVTAYVIDTGILTTHVDFEGRAHFGVSTTGETDNGDGNGHGTHVASTIGGVTYGVAKKVNLVAVKVLSASGSGTWAGVVDGVNWVAKNHTDRGAGALSVANMSLGGGATPTLDAAVTAAIHAGVHMSIAAGNDNGLACNYSPARVPDAITVGATTNSADNRASFSNYGKCVDIFAPGQAITAAYINNPKNSGTQSLSGTSMAAPHVAGVLAVHLGHLKATGGAIPDYKDLATWLTTTGSPNKVVNPGTGSPNILVFSPSA